MLFDAKPERPGLLQRSVAWLFKSQVEDLIANARLKSDALVARATQEVEAIRRQATSLDKDDHLWNGIFVSKRDLNPIDQDRLIEVANHLATRNPLAKRIREVRRDFVIGEGITIKAKDQRIQKLFDEVMKDPVNNFDEFFDQLVDYLGINGELFIPTFVNNFTGAVQWGWIEPSEVEKVVPDARNRRLMRMVVMKVGKGAGADEAIPTGAKLTYQIIHVDRSDVMAKSWNYRVGNIHHFKINCAPDARRGRSDFEAFADLVDAWDQATFNDLERAIQLIKFIWDVTFEDLDEPQIEEKLKKMVEPGAGSIRAHNGKVKWQAVSPQLGTAEFRKLCEGIRDDVLGAAGLSPTFYGITENSNLASAQAIDMPILKGLTARQKKVKAIIREMFDYVIDQKAMSNQAFKNALELGKIDRSFDVDLPEISIKDLSKIGAVLTQIATGLDIAVEREWLSNETAGKAFNMFLQQFDIQANYEEEQEKIAKEKTESEDDPDTSPDVNDKNQGKLADRFRKANKDSAEEDAAA